MSLTAGNRLGAYEIIGPIGAGGMGEVYRAKDTNLGRHVAIKLLPENFASDTERVARFDREAKLLASLNHPNIASIYGFESGALVMELVEGDSPHGPMAFDDAWKIASQIAAALEYAHEKGIVHRDLKPANIKITNDGVVKLLDFGLAKAFIDPVRAPQATLSNSPTLTMASDVGVILGTAAYMAPEQAKGRNVDKRADIWSFGVVLYELLTGRQLFEGEDVSETLAQVLTKQPDLEAVPVRSRRLLQGCLQKDPKLRLRDIGDASKLLDFSVESPEINLDVRKRRQWVPWTAAAVAMGLALSLVWIRVRETGPVPEQVRFQIFPRDQFRLGGFQVSPDGRQVAFVETDGRGVGRLLVRALDSLETRVLAEQSTAVPFWSPDGKYVAFVTDQRLRKVAISGGLPQTIADVPFATRGGAWSPNGTILLGSAQGLWSVPDAGGSLSQVTAIDIERQENSHSFPSFLPDGRRFIYLRRSAASENSGIYLGALNAQRSEDTSRRLVSTETGAAVSDGHLFFLREDILVAQPLDVERGVLKGEPMTIVEPVAGVLNIGYGLFSVSNSGTLVYRTGTTTQTHPAWFVRTDGKSSPFAESGDYGAVALSRDGSRLALTRRNRTWDIEVVDPARGSSMRLTFDAASEGNPVWSPDKSLIAFSSSQKDAQGIHVKASDGTRDEETLIPSVNNVLPNDWSPDGNYLLYTRVDASTAEDLWLFSVKDRKSKPFLATKAREGQGQISNDGRFVAYTSDQSGRAEIYVRTFPDGGGPWQVSRDGGVEPRWRGDDNELFFRVLNNRPPAVVEVFRDPTFRVGPPQMWFNSNEPWSFLGAGGMTANPRWAPTPDGKKIIAVVQENQEILSPLTVVTHWQTGPRK